MLKKIISKINLRKIYFKVLNSKFTYISIFLIILIQFIMVSIIYFEQKKSKYFIEQTNFQAATIENQQKQLSTQMNTLQSNVMRMQSQILRMQSENLKEKN